MINLSNILPEYPQTPHLPFLPNIQKGDIIADEIDAKIILNNEDVFIEEKIDGANCGIMLFDGHPIIRNRSNILKKGYVKKETPAKLQFRSIWNWYYENEEKFKKLNKAFGGPVGVYAEWCLALHGIEYNALPSHFIAFDVYNPENNYFIRTDIARVRLEECGFVCAPLLHKGSIGSYDELSALISRKSTFSNNELVEGLYIKVIKGDRVAKRYKTIRPGYIQGQKWSQISLTKQLLKGADG